MVTKITDRVKYEALFKKAWEELCQRKVFTDAELQHYAQVGNTFTSLEDYFTRIGTMINIPQDARYDSTYTYYDANGIRHEENMPAEKANELVPAHYEFILFPIDEPRFVINADTRDITIPSEFKRLVGVQGDHYAETLIFEIDRFYDVMDLWRAQIYIQWTDKNGIDHASPAVSKYYDAKNGKILFGWALDDEITAEARNINFSVRFFTKDMTPDANGNTEVTYSFSTKIHQITIAPTLQPNLNAPIIVSDVSKYYLSAIQDSPSADAPPAALPYFTTPAGDLIAELNIGNEAYELSVRPLVSDGGRIEFLEWVHKSLDGSTTTTLTGAVEKWVPVANPDSNRGDGKLTYYYEKASGVYEKYVDDITPDSPQLYFREYAYTIPADVAPITGSYQAFVCNRTLNNLSPRVGSTPCVLYGPGDTETVYYINPLVTQAIISGAGAEMSVSMTAPSVEKTDFTFEWKYSSLNDTELVANAVDAAELVIMPNDGHHEQCSVLANTPGWYKVIATAVRNRDEIVVESDVCRVTGTPQPVEFTMDDIQDEYDIGAANTVNIEVAFNQLHPEGAAEELYSDEIIYVWEAQKPGSAWEVLTDDETSRSTYRIHNSSSIHNNTLVVYGSDADTLDIRSYRCKVTNKLNGALSKTNTTKTISVR